MKRDFLNDEEREFLKNYEEKEVRTSKETLKEKYSDYSEEYKDYFYEEVHKQELDGKKKLFESLVKLKKEKPELWEDRKKELYQMIELEIYDNDIIPIIEFVEKM